jgi:hypothetical protein
MKSNGFSCLRVAALAVCVIGVALPAKSQSHYSSSELRQMMREASTADQDRVLATWFRGQEAAFRAKAEAEYKDFERYKTTVRTKVPTRADNARNLADHYSNKANEMSALATRYETQLAFLDPSYRPTTASTAAGTPCMATVLQSGLN